MHLKQAICTKKVTHCKVDVLMQFVALVFSQEIQKLTMQLREKELELESVRCQPDHEKDQEIQRLRSALEERERSEATRAVLCTSLAEEADQLRGQLGATVKVCQELLARLEEENKTERDVEEVILLQRPKEVCVCVCVMPLLYLVELGSLGVFTHF